MANEPKLYELPQYTPNFNGIADHQRMGKFTPFTRGIYSDLLQHCDWQSGIYFGCAEVACPIFCTRLHVSVAQISLSSDNRHMGCGEAG
jgi:hypothetical protein